MNHHIDLMEVLAAKGSAATYGGAITMVGSGVIVIFGYEMTQVQIAFVSMVVGALVGFLGISINLIFKYLSYKETRRMNVIKESVMRANAVKESAIRSNVVNEETYDGEQ